MRWQYRTILFEFQKEGLLGGLYVDDEAMEKTLNEQGGQGWELVSVTTISEGLLAFCKRALDEERIGILSTPVVRQTPAAEQRTVPERTALERQESSTSRELPGRISAAELQEREKEHIRELDRQRRQTVEDAECNLVGEIRIR